MSVDLWYTFGRQLLPIGMRMTVTVRGQTLWYVKVLCWSGLPCVSWSSAPSLQLIIPPLSCSYHSAEQLMAQIWNRTLRIQTEQSHAGERSSAERRADPDQFETCKKLLLEPFMPFGKVQFQQLTFPVVMMCTRELLHVLVQQLYHYFHRSNAEAQFVYSPDHADQCLAASEHK